MVDIVDQATRSRMMAGIRGRDTKPELLVRRGLHAAGFRYRLHAANLPGRPDIVLPKYRAVIFVHGCFWHGHDCSLFKTPASRTAFWTEKIKSNALRDSDVRRQLTGADWRVAVVWECCFKGKQRLPPGEAIQALTRWLHSPQSPDMELRGEHGAGVSID